MAHIEHSVRLQTAGVVLSRTDCAFLLPFLKKNLQKENAMVDKYQGILDGGEATERQTDLLFKYRDRVEHMEAIIHEVEFLAK